jgi:cephalosporin-C deacetylase-like acetyl esterase
MSSPEIATVLALALVVNASTAGSPARAQAQEPARTFPGTEPWADTRDPASAMVEGIHAYLDRELAASVQRRQEHWKRDTSSSEAYLRSIAPNRERFRTIIGAVGERVAPVVLTYVSAPDSPAKVAENDRFAVFAVRWTVYPGVEAEGLLLEPKGTIRANVVALPDCDITPEQFAGLAPGVEPSGQLPRLFAEIGGRVLVPALIDRTDEFSGNPRVRMTNLPHREWIYRMAFETGRHIIGYEVDEVRAALDWFTRPGEPPRPIEVAGQGEGGLIALYASAVDTRVDSTYVAGYFGPREQVWQEPIYRNVWGLLAEFGDAEIGGLISPRSLVIQGGPGPEVAGPPAPRGGRNTAAPGRLTSTSPTATQAEFDRMMALDLPASERFALKTNRPSLEADHLTDARKSFDPRARMKRLVEHFSAYTQGVIRTSELRRYEYWSRADTSSPEKWTASVEPLRNALHEELIGKLPEATEPLSVRTRQIFDEPNWTGYAVQIPVWPDVVASGILLWPRDLKPGERRPVVVCQHGLEGRPNDIVDPRIKSVYNAYGARLADRGYIVYAPQNPYIGKDRFRLLQRKLNPLKASMFSVIVRQHERTLEWLAGLPQVDEKRIAFYGLSYGGKTAMRVPAILPRYCLSICSGDFNEWVVKNTNLDRPLSYMFSGEWEMPEFALAERFNYAEMAGLIAPRPFMVERGHKDGVAPDEWVGYEYAKVRRLYDTLGLTDHTEIGYFNAGHMIDGRATFAFLARELNWPRGDAGD